MNNEERVLFNKLRYEGKVFETNSSGELIIVNYKNRKQVLIRFLNTGYEVWCDLDKILLGKVKDKLSPTVYGVGIVGEHQIRSGGKIIRDYLLWANMLKRCYDTSSLKTRPSYEHCRVSNSFVYFEMFKLWYGRQVGANSIDHTGKYFCLDKDIIVKGNKIYSPETCCFVPNEINALVLNHGKGRGKQPVGVSYHKATGKFVANMNYFGDSLHLGSFKTPEEAFQAYKQAKESHIKVVANKWKDDIDSRAYESLMNWEVEIND